MGAVSNDQPIVFARFLIKTFRRLMALCRYALVAVGGMSSSGIFTGSFKIPRKTTISGSPVVDTHTLSPLRHAASALRTRVLKFVELILAFFCIFALQQKKRRLRFHKIGATMPQQEQRRRRRASCSHLQMRTERKPPRLPPSQPIAANLHRVSSCSSSSSSRARAQRNVEQRQRRRNGAQRRRAKRRREWSIARRLAAAPSISS